jgi:hypothetical protein
MTPKEREKKLLATIKKLRKDRDIARKDQLALTKMLASALNLILAIDPELGSILRDHLVYLVES